MSRGNGTICVGSGNTASCLNRIAHILLEVVRSLGLLDKLAESLDPLNSDLGRARVSENMPRRIR